MPSVGGLVIIVVVLVSNLVWWWRQEPEFERINLVSRLNVLRQDRAASAADLRRPEEVNDPWEGLTPPIEIPEDRLIGRNVPPEPALTERMTLVGEGDNLARALDRLFIHGAVKRRVIQAYKTQHDPRLIRPGQRLFAQFDSPSPMDAFALQSLVVAPVGRGEGISVVRSGEETITYRARPGGLPGHMHRQVLRCPLTGGLEVSLRRCGHGGGLARLVAALLSLRLDLRADLRQGDVLRLVFDELVANDERIRYERVVGLRFDGAKASFTGVSWQDNRGRVATYTPEGDAVEPMFLRDLVYGARLTSVFGMRMHPILKKMKPHLGIDLAAPIGTPVRAAADGVIMVRRRAGAAGKIIRIRHGRRMVTEYFHLHRWVKKLYPGLKVSRGQVIGYVGNTGRSTAPHLHFGVRRAGKHVDPLKAFDTPGKAVPARQRSAFIASSKPILKLLNRIDEVASERLGR